MTTRRAPRIASSRNAPERVEHCLTRMLPAPRQFVNRLRGFRRPTRRDTIRLSCSIGRPCFPVPTWRCQATARSGGDGRSGATRSHAQRAVAREHGEDGEYRTFPEASTVAHSRRSRIGLQLSIAKHDVTNRCRAYCVSSVERCLSRYLSQRLTSQTPSYAPAHAATFSPGAVASGAARQGRGRDALLAAARTVRAKFAMAQPRTIRAATPSLSPTGRDDVGHAEPLPSAY